MRYYDSENKALLYFLEKSIENFWECHWAKTRKDLRTWLMNFNPKSFVCRTTKRFLHPNAGPILEGGCGFGKNVISLQKMNYDAIGIDNAESTIKRVKRLLPEINVMIGDVRKLDFPDNHFAGYWSLGVIEHFFNGYQTIMREMQRVIKPGGYLFLTFPYMSLFRYFKVRINFYRLFNAKFYELYNKPKNFYQFALDKNKTINNFRSLGFTHLHEEPFEGLKGFKDEIFFLKFFLNRDFLCQNI